MTGREYWLKLFTENETALASAVILIERFVNDEQLASGSEYIKAKKEELRKKVADYRVELTFPDLKESKQEGEKKEMYAYKKTIFSIHLNTSFTKKLKQFMSEAMILNEDFGVTKTFGTDFHVTFQMAPLDKDYVDFREEGDMFTIYLSPKSAIELHNKVVDFESKFNEGDSTLIETKVIAGYTVEFHYTIN